MAAAALGRMRVAVRAKLPLGPGIQTPGRLARPLVLALLLASATMANGKGGAAGRDAGAGWTRARSGSRAEPGKGQRFGQSGAGGAGQRLCRGGVCRE